MPTSITTEVLGDHPRLSEINCGLPLAASWIKNNEGFVAFGIYKSHEVRGKKRFHDASLWWKNELTQLEIHNNVHGSGTGPIIFTSFSFDEEEPSLLVIPQVVIVVRNGKSWITWIGDKQPSLTKAVHPSALGPITWAPGSLTDEQWCERIQRSVDRIKLGELDKVVLARDIVATTSTPIDPLSLVHELDFGYPSTWVYSVGDLVGATPELLVRLSKTLVTSRVLAGTIRRSGDEERDLALAASLAKSSKDLEEHEYAVRSVADALAPYASSTNVPESPYVLHLPNVMHLATDVTGVINESPANVDIFTLSSALHPSAAVCGTPTEKAEDLIKEYESMNRGRYAGPVGWVDARGDGEIGIALRCGQLSEDHKSIRLFAGCGIVAGSDPIQELAESQAKLLPIRSALQKL